MISRKDFFRHAISNIFNERPIMETLNNEDLFNKIMSMGLDPATMTRDHMIKLIEEHPSE